MIRAAGILFRTADRRVLFLQRAAGGDHAGEWCLPGGKVEDGETSEQAAVRETEEEAGRCPRGKRVLLARTVSGQGATPVETPGDAPTSMVVPQEEVDFTTYLQEVGEPFDVETDEESTGHAWAHVDSPPEPLHPGVAVALRRLAADELGVARMMAAGELTSPQYYENVALFSIRITGTGTSYRKAHDEYVYRPPEEYLTPEFLARCSGLPVLWEHPAKATLDSKEWSDRVVGTTFLPFIKGDEVWGIVKIYDGPAIKIMAEGGLSTSPTVNFRDLTVNTKARLEDGSALLIEGKPSLLDHIAICDKGVWDKGGPAAGVSSAKADSDMSDEDKKAKDDAAKADQAKADQARKDAENEMFGKLMSKMDSLSSRMDSWDEEKKKADKAKADADEEEKKKADKAKADEGEKEESKANEAANEPGAGDPKEVERKAADKAKADEDEKKEREDRAKKDAEEEKKRMDAARADAAERDDLKAQLAAMQRRLDARNLSDDDYAKLSVAQARADNVYRAFGQRAPRHMEGETELAYRRRLLAPLKQHSVPYAQVNLEKAFNDAAGFEVAETHIYSDAMTASRSPVGVPQGEMREVRHPDHTGRDIIDFIGEPRAWLRDFMAPTHRLLPGSLANRGQ